MLEIFFALRTELSYICLQNKSDEKVSDHIDVDDLVRIAPERVVYISSDGNYSTLVQADGEMRMLSFQLGQLERLIVSQLGSEGNTFIRIGKSLIINRSYIYYINVTKQRLVLSDITTVNHSVSASREALKQLKELLEKEAK